ncbi:MAG: hypothetical protein IPL53_09300 [Ignavibacteria bacterium]|nr:hypothetical protein [Ignavibacteria bacterium]
MKKLTLFFFILISSIGFCKDPDSDFESLMNKFIDEYLHQNPQTAVYLGIHEYDGKISDYSMASINSELDWAEDYLKKLSEIDPGSLSKNNYVNYKILLSDIKSTIFL